MEYYCIEARALKSSFLSSQMGDGLMNKTGSSSYTRQAVPHDDIVWCFAGSINNNNNNNVVGGTCDDFPVEELLNLDFNEKEFEGGCFFPAGKEDGDDVAEKKISSSTSSFSSGVLEDDMSIVGELAVPLDGLENLEWLSQFVDDSASNPSTLLYPLDIFTKKTGSNHQSKQPIQSSQTRHFPMHFPRKTRSKRSRSSGRSWSFSFQPLIASDSSSSSSSSSLSSKGSSTFSMIHDQIDGSENPSVKKQKRKFELPRAGIASIGRTCTHCQVQKTPQWRTGPLGPKTLCNACGVRYKLGRLFPEYLPACSPLFSQEVHSNSHRKVLELRRKKEMVGSVLAEPALARVVPSCRGVD